MIPRILELSTERHHRQLDAFLAQHNDSSLFLRNNLALSGLVYKDCPFHAQYYAALLEDQKISGAIGHCWNGNLLLQAPRQRDLLSLLSAFKSQASRPLAGIMGPQEQVITAHAFLGLKATDFSSNRCQGLYTLDLENLKTPSYPPHYALRAASKVPKKQLMAWLVAYIIEASISNDDIRGQIMAQDIFERLHLTGDGFVLFKEDTPVALCAFNARVGQAVQLGPIFTPANQRSKGYARLCLALALKMAAQNGTRHGVLFTDNPAAKKAYEAVGFCQAGNYYLSLLKRPISPSL